VDSHTISLLSVPLFTGAIGWLTNWSGVWMLFYPVTFKGRRIPGLAKAVRLLPSKIQQIPGVKQGGIGWQGIIPSRAATMGSIAVDKGIAKLGSPREFYEKLDPEAIAEQILSTARGDIHDVVERIMEREHPQLWNDLPPAVRERMHARVQEQLPQIVRDVTDEIGQNIDQLIDIKQMVIKRVEEEPALLNRIFLDIGQRELKFIVNFGFWFGLVLGIPLAIVTEILLPYWWIVPIGGVLVGYATNWIGLWMIFNPIEPRRFVGRDWQGLFLRRQPEVAGVYAKIIADDIVTLGNLGGELLEGPRADRTRFLIETAVRPAVDGALGPARSAVRVAVGTQEYDAIRESVGREAVDYTLTPLQDEEFNARQSSAVRELITARIKEMPERDFAEMLHTAIAQDEWMLLLHGAVLGFGAGLIHLVIFG
jgi:uncharacterized membrane protein YheB (UPF0754 family)